MPEALPLRRSARLLLFSEKGRLLLFRYQDEHRPPFWATVGGELRPGEDFLAAARRELLEETGFEAPVGPMLRERRETYAVARSTPARWHERYFLVRCVERAPSRAGWTEEEQSTIRDWKWWGPEEMPRSGATFLPEWLPELAASLSNAPQPEPKEREPT